VTVDSGLVARLRRQLSQGELILFTGAGFSLAAVARSGTTVPSVKELKRGFWHIAFPSAPEVDPNSSLGDLFDLALSRGKNSMRDLLSQGLTIDPTSSPVRFKDWFSLPWYRHYTLNIDDLDEAIAAHYDLPRPLIAISGNIDSFVTHPGLLSVHLNGRLKDFPEITFSARQYGQRASRPDGWYQTLVADLLNHPVLFIGTTLDEPGLWQYIELRRQRTPSEVEMRPASYLVSPEIPAAKAALLKQYNINWIEAREDEFFATALANVPAESELGHAKLSQRYQISAPGLSLKPVAELRKAPAIDDLGVFLLGREPTWADLQGGFAIERSFDKQLLNEVLTGNHQLVMLTGTAASGKSTTAMRLTLALEAESRKAYAFNAIESDSLNIASLVNRVRCSDVEVVLIDNLDLFGARTARLVHELAGLQKAPLVIGVIRSSRMQALDLSAEIGDLRALEKTVPNLHDEDIDLLINALTGANRLGRLSGKSKKECRQVFRHQAGRQLLVAMYYATSGEKLQDRVHSECADLGGASRLAYGMVALATVERQWLTREELIIGIGAMGSGEPGNQTLNEMQRLIDRNLIIANGRELRLRHRWIAETAMEFYISNGLVGSILKALTFTMAAKSDPQLSRSSRERRLLRRLINHDYLQRMTADIGVTRQIYSLLEDQLAWDYHYWLQRGSLEVESGDLALAENFLNAARSLAANRDYRIETEYGYMLLKKAAKNPRSPGSVESAESALLDLEDWMRGRGQDDSYVFHVYGSQGLSWARRAPGTPAQRADLIRRLCEAVQRGVELHPHQRDLQRLRDDLKREYMSIAVDDLN
jgi:hypothetical protein